MMLAIVLLTNTFLRSVNLIVNPDQIITAPEPLSIVVKGCPTRGFQTTPDIYNFCWTLCQKKAVLRDRQTIFLESEIPSAFQQH
jgi:hypothetical protein